MARSSHRLEATTAAGAMPVMVVVVATAFALAVTPVSAATMMELSIVRSDLVPLARNGTLSLEHIRSHPAWSALPSPLHTRYNRLLHDEEEEGKEDQVGTAGEEGSARRRSSSNEMNLIGYPTTAYSVIMTVGNPTQQLACVVDTGSSNLAVAASKQGALRNWFNMGESTTLVDQGTSFQVNYVSASFEAQRVMDFVSFRDFPMKMMEKVEFGAITSSTNFFEAGTLYEGILGMAYGALAMPPKDPVVPYFDTFVQAENVPSLFSLELCDVKDKTGQSTGFGRMSIGDYLPDRINGTVFYSPLKTHQYYSVMVTQVKLGIERINLPCHVYNSPGYTIVDSGTTDILVPLALHKQIVKMIDAIITREAPDALGTAADKKKFYRGEICNFGLTDDVILKLPPLVFSVESASGANLEIDLATHPWHYMRAFTVQSTMKVCRRFAVVPHCTSGSGIILGIALMANFVTIFDRTNHRIGFAPSTCSGYYTPDGAEIHVDPIAPPRTRETSDVCDPDTRVKCVAAPTQMTPLVYVAIGCGSFALVLFGVFIYLQCKYHRERTKGKRYRQAGTEEDESEDDTPNEQRQDFQIPQVLSEYEDDAMLLP